MTARLPALLALVATLAIALAPAARADAFDEALERALSGSAAVSASRHALRAAVEEVPFAYSTKTLTTELNVSGTSTDTSSNDGEFNDTSSATARLTLRQPIYDGGIAKAQKSINELAVDRARAQLGLTEQTVLLEAINAYVGLVVARDRAELQRANARRLEEYLRATGLRLELGEATPTDLAATQAQSARANANLITAETSLENAEETYRSIIGEPPGGISLPAPPSEGIPGTAVAAGNQALEGNHAHRIAHVAERSSRRALDLLTANVRPKVDLSLTGRTVETDDDKRHTDEVSAGVTLSMPIAPNSAVRARARSSVASHRAAVFSLRDSERSTRLGAEVAFRDYRAASRVIDAFSAELDAAVLLRDGTSSEVDFGLKTVLDLLDTEQDVVNAQVSLLEANRNRIVAAYALLASLGRLSAADLGLEVDVGALDGDPIKAPIVLRPLPVLKYDE